MNVLITGAASGIGYALMNEFISHDHFVIGLDINEIKNEKCLTFKCDITNEESLSSILNELKRKEIKLDAIVNIAGVHLMASLIETDPQKMKKLLDINLYGTMLVPVYIPLTGIGLPVHAVGKMDDMGENRTVEHVSADWLGVDFKPPAGFDICDHTFCLPTSNCVANTNTEHSQKHRQPILMKSMSKASANIVPDDSDLSRRVCIRGGLPMCYPGSYDLEAFRMCELRIVPCCRKRYAPWFAYPGEQALWNRHCCFAEMRSYLLY